MKYLTTGIIVILALTLSAVRAPGATTKSFIDEFEREVSRYLVIGHQAQLRNIINMFESQESHDSVLDQMFRTIDRVADRLEEQGKFNEELYNKLIDAVCAYGRKFVDRDIVSDCLDMALEIAGGGFGVITGGFIPTGLDNSHYTVGVGKLLDMVPRLCHEAEREGFSAYEGALAVGVACMKCKVPPSMWLAAWGTEGNYQSRVYSELTRIGDAPFME